MLWNISDAQVDLKVLRCGRMKLVPEGLLSRGLSGLVGSLAARGEVGLEEALDC